MRAQGGIFLPGNGRCRGTTVEVPKTIRQEHVIQRTVEPVVDVPVGASG